ncbi:epidermal growth factor-like protein 7 isoform X8 [Equus quagga]|uniref:epidermal growth factor-like protein 7 isoform X8 n=1 Tax=Equus quagga TaxID=89248 RepID=UPI001EE3511D|nr:epidermal growth factor-like protein 7 isoform X8 [Equus quagga]
MAKPGPGQHQAPAQRRHGWPPLPRRAAATRVQGMTEPPSLGHPEEKAVPPGDTGHVGLPGAASGVVPGAGSGRHPAYLPAWPQGVCHRGSQGPRVRVLRATRVPALSHHLRRAPSLQHIPQYASLHARTEGSVSSQAAATALQDGGATPARQTWMNAVLDRAAVPSAVSTPQGVIGASVGRGTAPLRMGQSACPREGPPGSPTRTPQQPTDWKTVPSGVPSGSRPGSLETPHLRWRRDIITFGVDSEVKEEVQRLRSRVDVLEQKLQLVLAPLHSLASRALEHGLPDPGSLLAHSFQQLDRIDSLSEQISFLEEQLGSCSCKKEL